MGEIVVIKDHQLLDVTPVENIFIAQYMTDAPDIAVKVYLYGLMLAACPQSASDDIGAALNIDDLQLRTAIAYWAEKGLIRIIADEPLQIQYYNIKRYINNTQKFNVESRYTEFVKALQGVLGTRILNGAELSKIYDWLEVFGLEQPAAVEVVKRCLDKKGARTSVSYMDAVAQSLAGAGKRTLDAVKEHFEEESIRSSDTAKLLRKLGKYRLPTEAELAMYEKWTKAWGFDITSIEMACERMNGAEKPSFKYLDSILDAWRAGGVVNLEDIEKNRRIDDEIFELSREAFNLAGIKRSPTVEDRLHIKEWNMEWRMSAELIKLAAELSNKARTPFSKIKRIMEEWHEQGLSSVSAAKAYYEAYQKDYDSKRATTKKSSRSLNYIKGESYTDEDLKKLGISLGEEFYNDDAE